jgi:inhibitor of KinA
VADHALLVEFGEVIADDIHAAVLSLDAAICAAGPEGVRECVPSYASLLIDFDPLLTDHRAVAETVGRLLTAPPAPPLVPTTREVLVCYDDPFAPDMDAVMRQTGLSRDAVIAAHLSGDYRVYMYGFAPGYAYLAGVPLPLRIPRKPAPVRGVAKGSVMIAGPQCLVTTLMMPSGWWVIGRSPTPVLSDDPARPFLFGVGDSVVFRRVPARDMPGPGPGSGPGSGSGPGPGG